MIVLKVMLYSTQKKTIAKCVCVYVNLWFATNATLNIDLYVWEVSLWKCAGECLLLFCVVAINYMANVLISGEPSPYFQGRRTLSALLISHYMPLRQFLGGECCFRVGLFAFLNSCKLSYLRRKLSLFCKKCVLLFKKNLTVFTLLTELNIRKISISI